MEQAKILDEMKQLAVSAGDAIMKVYATDFNVDYKADESPLTQADKNANAIIVEGLKKLCPEYAILSEEVKDEEQQNENK